MTKMARRTGKKVRTGIVKISLTLAAALTLLSMTALPAFAWSSSMVTCVGSYTSSTYPASCTTNPTVTGASVSDTAKLTLTSNGAPYGTVSFTYASGTCTSHGTASTTGITGASRSVTGSGTTYYVATLATGSLSAGSYVWLVSYSGTGAGGYPPVSNDCEPFTFSVTHGVPEFSLGMPLLLALTIPAMLLMRRSLPKA